MFLPVSTYRKKRFLELQQPIDEAYLSPVSFDKTGFLYQIPFTFVVPDQLPVQICRHVRDGWDENCGHLMLPPSLGKGPSGKSQFALDDMGCNSMSIVYSVQAKLSNRHARRDQSNGPWSFAFKSIPVIPTHYEAAQGDVSLIPELRTHSFCLSKTSQLDSGKGYVCARAWSPRPIELRLPLHDKPELSTSLTRVELEFQSTRHEPPPSLRQISRKLIVHTVAHSMPFRPTLTGPACQSRPEISTRTVSLSRMDTSSIKFQPQFEYDLDSDEGKDSLEWSHDYVECDPPSQKMYYNTSIQIPIVLPDDKTFLPSFESCMISRSYEVELGIHYSSGWKGLGRSCLSIQLPLQIVS